MKDDKFSIDINDEDIKVRKGKGAERFPDRPHRQKKGKGSYRRKPKYRKDEE